MSPRSVTDRHEVSLVARRHEDYTGRILAEIASGVPVTQRQLSSKLGIALGLTNLLIRRVVQKGWVKVTHLKANRAGYLLTPTGVAEKTRLAQAYFENTIHLYTETRARIARRLERLSAHWPCHELSPAGEKRIVFFGAGEVSEIGYICLQRTDLRLVGVVDDVRKGRFFDLPISTTDALTPAALNGEPFGCVVAMSFRKAPRILERLGDVSFPLNRVAWLDDAVDSNDGAGEFDLAAERPSAHMESNE